MSAIFVKCSYPEINYSGVSKNPPINLANVTHITKSEFAYGGDVGTPSIMFHFVGGTKQSWVYPRIAQNNSMSRSITIDTKQRDDDYNRIIGRSVPEHVRLNDSTKMQMAKIMLLKGNKQQKIEALEYVGCSPEFIEFLLKDENNAEN